MLLVAATLVGVLAAAVAISAIRIGRRMEPPRDATSRPDRLLTGGMVNVIVGVVFVSTIGPIGLIQTAVGLALIAIGSIRTRRSTTV